MNKLPNLSPMASLGTSVYLANGIAYSFIPPVVENKNPPFFTKKKSEEPRSQPPD